jgi:putative endonuclease
MRSFRFTNLLGTKGTARQNTLRNCALTDLVFSTAELSARWLKPISRLRRHFRFLHPSAPHIRIGKRGEKIAVHFLQRSGYKVLFRNFRAKSGGEIDLVCRDRQAKVLVFVEVKTRTTNLFGDPHEAVTLRQQDSIIRAAKEWLRMLDDADIPYRFDIVEVLMEPRREVHLIRNAFQIREDIYF